jgi:subtilisin-like proprotein convertase family protein/V8-like Glu-specific endopeptidase
MALRARVQSVFFGVFAAVLVAAQAGAQTPAPTPTRPIDFQVDSGPVGNAGGAFAPVYSVDMVAPGSAWLRADLGGTVLSGDPNDETGAWLVLTSQLDGAVQVLNSEHLRQWGGVSAYFNGPLVKLELWAAPGTAPSRVVVRGLLADDPSVPAIPNDDAGPPNPGGVGVMDLCGSDDRVLSTDPRMGRLAPVGCTAWMFNDTNRMFITAGHCGPSGTSTVVQFNVPFSTISGTWVNPPPEDQYAIDPASVQFLNGGVGNDFSYFAVFPNPNTGLTPFQRQGAAFTLAAAAPSVAGQSIRVTGYGSVSSPVSPTWQAVQKTHAGPYTSMTSTTVRYNVDTTGGNSGSPVVDETTGQAIGIHTHAGCTAGGNQGTAAQQASFRAAINAPRSICRSGLGSVSGSLYALGDLANNFGTVSVAPANFARIATLGARWQGASFDPAGNRVLAIDASRGLFAVTLAGVMTSLGTVTGTGQTLAGLSYDPFTPRLFAVAPSTGQVFTIDPSTLVASPLGAPLGGSVRAMEFDQLRRTLFAIDTAAPARLLRIDPATGARSVVGPLGGGLVSAGDLAANASDGQLYTINPDTADLVRISPVTGQAASLGSTAGSFTTAFGLASATSPPPGFVLAGTGVTMVNDLFANGNANGFAEPGEQTLRVWAELLCAGQTAGGPVQAGVVSLTPTVTITTDQTSWPAMAPGQARFNDTPIVLNISPAHPCGQPVTLRITAAAEQGGGTIDVQIPVGLQAPIGAPSTFTFSGPAVGIPLDNPAGVATSVNVSGPVSIADVDFRLNGTSCSTAAGATTVGLDHSWIGDLTLTLTSPAGTTVTLLSRPGGADNSGRNLCQTLLDDSATNAIQSVTAANAPFTGSFRPAQPLAAFNAQNPAGVWTLRAIDAVSTDSGFVRNWSLIIRPPGAWTCAPPAAVPCQADYNADGFMNLDDLGDFITDFYTVPPVPGPGGFAVPCPNAAPPYDQGYRAGFVIDGSASCTPPTLDNLSDYITYFYASYLSGC